MSNHTSVPDDLAQRFGLVPVDDLEVTHLDLWSDGRRPAVRPVTADNILSVLAAVSDHDADLHVLVVLGPGTGFSWTWGVCTVRGRTARWLTATPRISLAELLADLDEDERALLATWGSLEIDVALDPPDDDPIETTATESHPSLP